MKSRCLHLIGAALILGVAAVAACTASVSAGAGNGTTCAQDSTVSCNDGTGYSCTGSDAPQDSNSSLVCDYGEPGNAGSTTYCCLTAVATSSSCGPDSTVGGCVPGSFGFSCANATEPPTAAYPQLTCSTGQQGNAGSEIYCCTDGTTVVDEDSGFDAGSCAQDSNVACDSGTGYSCLGMDTPVGLSCSSYLNDDAGISEYCCSG